MEMYFHSNENFNHEITYIHISQQLCCYDMYTIFSHLMFCNQIKAICYIHGIGNLALEITSDMACACVL